MSSACPGCGQDSLRAYRRTQTRGVICTYSRCPCGQHFKEEQSVTDVASEHFHRRANNPAKLLPPLDPDVRCDNCSSRGSLRVQSDSLDQKRWVRRLACICLACDYHQQHFEAAPPRPRRQRAC